MSDQKDSEGQNSRSGTLRGGLFRRLRKQPGGESAPAADAPEQGNAQSPRGAGSEVSTPATAADSPSLGNAGLFSKLRRRLTRTHENLVDGLADLINAKKTVDDDVLEELETRLLLADVGVEATGSIISRLGERASRRDLRDVDALLAALSKEMRAILEPVSEPLPGGTEHRPYVILMVGVNGVGKTTTIGKLARRFLDQGRTVMLAAGDTFRAAAVEQLLVWGERNRVPVVAQEAGADAASVIFDAVQSARARGIDVVIADTAGRLHTQTNLMNELEKIHRVIAKVVPDAPHEVMLVLDAGTGQNALSQAIQFNQAVAVTGITLTKLDGTAKGGIIFAIARRLGIPIRFIGVGESLEDLRVFDADEFVGALLASPHGEHRTGA